MARTSLAASFFVVPIVFVEDVDVDVAVVMGKVVTIGVFGINVVANVDGTTVVIVGITFYSVVPTSPCFN